MKNNVVETMALYAVLKVVFESDNNLADSYKKKYGGKTIHALVENMIKEREDTYMACFTLKDKNIELSCDKYNLLWRYYADNYKGVAIEFNKNQICNSSKHSVISSSESERVPNFELIDMIYDEDEFLEAIDLNKNKEKILNSLYLGRYKPKCCQLEHETRLAVYLPSVSSVKTKTKINLCHEINGRKDTRDFYKNAGPYLYYDIASSDREISAIQKIYCRNSRTQDILTKLINPDIVVLI